MLYPVDKQAWDLLLLRNDVAEAICPTQTTREAEFSFRIQKFEMQLNRKTI